MSLYVGVCMYCPVCAQGSVSVELQVYINACVL